MNWNSGMQFEFEYKEGGKDEIQVWNFNLRKKH